MADQLLERVLAIDQKYALPKLQENTERLKKLTRQLRDQPIDTFPPEDAHQTERQP